METELTGMHWDPSLKVGDVDNNGTLDVVLTGEIHHETPMFVYDGSARLYLGDGTGGFTEKDAALTGVHWGSSSMGDVDNDGTLDLVVTGLDPSGAPSARLYLGDGRGGFAEREAGLMGVTSSASAFGDVNHDGAADLIITGARVSTPLEVLEEDGLIRMLERLFTGYYPSGAPTATLYLGDGDGGFTAQDAGLTGVREGASAFGDVNADGHLDLVISGMDAAYDRTTTVYLGDGRGGFAKTDG